MTESPGLNSSQRKFLRGLAHDLKPTVQLGKNGATHSFVRQLDLALGRHELVKVRLAGSKAEKLELLETMARDLQFSTVGLIGHVATVFRQNQDPGERQIKLG